MTSIFSTYSTGENRVTASFLAVLRSLSLDRMQRLIGSLLEQSEFELIRFENQPSKGGSGFRMRLSRVACDCCWRPKRNAMRFACRRSCGTWND